MPLRNIKTKLYFLRHVPSKYYFIVGVLFVMVTYLVLFREKTLAYSYGSETCGQRLVLLPGVFSQAGNAGYGIEPRGGLYVFGYHLAASSLCLSPTEAPMENSSNIVAYAPWGGWFARLTYRVEARDHPEVDATVLRTPIAVTKELELPLSEPDATFSYQLEVGGSKTQCLPNEIQLVCDVPSLGLKQGTKYSLALEKYFGNEKVDDVTTTDIETLSPLAVTGSSIDGGATVYDRPKSITLSVDKPLSEADFSVWRTDSDTPVEIESTTTLNERQVIVTLKEELPRQAVIELKPIVFEAIDGSTTLDPYTLAFKTSGGPKVLGVNVGSTGVGIGSQIAVTFDQELATDQDLSTLMEVGGDVVYQARRGNQLLFSTGGADLCQNISITLKADISSPYDVSGQSAWEYSGRTQCYTISTIGYSSQGRVIYAYHFGNSGPSVVYIGAIHGSEVSTKYLMDRWIEELDADPASIPANKRVIVVPSVNPDGLAVGSRENARNVDLNRNFATSDWKKNIEYTNGSSFPGGGGEEAMSEPETKAISGFIAQQRPELVISYHSIGGMVISNQGGQANSRASQYASLSGYRLSPGGGGEFGYAITGTADDYYREKLGVPSILIELGSHSYHQFERNRAAMWAVMR